jgi:hypothetical protein
MHHAYKTTDLAPDERLAIERLLGRQLENDESVEVIAHKVDELRSAPGIVDRKLAAAGILELAKGKSLGGATVRELIDEGRRF